MELNNKEQQHLLRALEPAEVTGPAITQAQHYRSADDVRRQIRADMESLGWTQAECAAHFGISAAYLNDVLCCRREPGKKLLDALGLERVTYYRPLPVIGSGGMR